MTPEQLIGKTIEILHMAGGTPNSPSFPFQVGSKLVVKNCKMSGSDYVLFLEGTTSSWHAALGHNFKICDLPSVPQVKSPRWGNLETTEEWKALIGEYVEILDSRGGGGDIQGKTFQVVDSDLGTLKLRGHFAYKGIFWHCDRNCFRVVPTPTASVQDSTTTRPTKEEVARRYSPGTKYTPFGNDGRLRAGVVSEARYEPKNNGGGSSKWWVNDIPDDYVFTNGNWAPIVEIDTVPLIPPNPISNPAARQWTDYSFEEIWEEAKRRYPVGTKFTSVIDSRSYVVVSHETPGGTKDHWNKNKQVWFYADPNIPDFRANVFKRNIWAEIIEQPKPAEPDYDAILHKARNDYPIGCSYKALIANGDVSDKIREVIRTPNWVGDRQQQYIDGGIDYLYVKGKWAEIVTTASPTAPNRDDILTEAIRRYPIGTKVITVNSDRNPHREEVVNGTPRKYNDNLDKIDWQGSFAFLYYQGHWATIVQEVQTAEKPEVTSAEAILAEAIKRYPIGTKVRCVTGEEETVTDTPRLYPRRGDKSSAQIDWEDSKGFLYLPSHGNRWAEILSASKDPREALLDEARERYPEGSVVRCLTHGTWEKIENVEGHKPKWQDHLRIRMGRHATRVYTDGVWAIRDDSQTPDKGEESTESAQATSVTNSQAQSAAAVQAITEKDPRTYTIEEALEECKRRYPPGTRVIPIQGGTNKPLPQDEFIVRANTHKIYSREDATIDLGGYHGGLLYRKGTWAQIVSFGEAVSEEPPNVELKISTPDTKMTGVKAEKIIETPLVEKKKHIYF